jgi:hypothetical protein
MDSAGSIVKCYRGYRSRWTLDVADVRFFDSRAEAERFFDHSQWVVVPESEVLIHLTTRVLTDVDDP